MHADTDATALSLLPALVLIGLDGLIAVLAAADPKLNWEVAPILVAWQVAFFFVFLRDSQPAYRLCRSEQPQYGEVFGSILRLAAIYPFAIGVCIALAVRR